MTHLGDRIAAFVDGQLPDDERRVAEHHVSLCDECRRKVREQRLLKSRMTSLRAVEAPEHLLASLRGVERLEPDHPPERGWIARCLRSTSVRTVVAVTGASVTVTVLAYAVGGPRPPDEPEITPAVEQFTAQFEASAAPVDGEDADPADDGRDDPPAPDTTSNTGVGGESGAGDEAQIASDTLDALTESGWPCHPVLASDLNRVRGHWVDLNGEHAVRLTYTDGLSRLALYEQRGRLDPSGLHGFDAYRLDGATVWIRDDDATRVAVWSAADVVYTAVTDAPTARLHQVVAELPQESTGDDGSLRRIETGLRRMGSWLAPV